MNRKILFIAGISCFLFGTRSLFAAPPEYSVADSLKRIYVSLVPAGANFIVNQGKWEALFDKDGMPLTGFDYKNLRPGLDGNVIAYSDQDCFLLDAKGKFLFKFGDVINHTDTIHRLYRYYDAYRSKDEKATGSAYNDSGEVVLRYYDSKAYPMGYCLFSDPKNVQAAGVKDTFGQVILPAAYDKVSVGEWGIGALRNDTAFVFDRDGRFRFSCIAQDLQMLQQGALAVQIYGLWCLKDSTGKSLTPFKYTEIKAIKNGSYLEAGEYILDYEGREAARPGFHNSLYCENGWYAISYPNKPGYELWDEHFNRVFDAGEYAESGFSGNRFIWFKKHYDDTATLFYDREKKKFSKLDIQEELPGNAFLLAAKDTFHRFILKENKKLKFPYFTNIKAIEQTPFLLVDAAPRRMEPQYMDIARMPVYVSGAQPEYPSGLLDTHFRMILPLNYAAIQVLNKNLIAARSKGHKRFDLMDGSGKVLLTLAGNAEVKEKGSVIGIASRAEYYLVDSLGHILFRGNYPSSPLYPDLSLGEQPDLPRLLLCMDSSGYYGLYDLQGKQLLPHEYYPVMQQMEGIFSLKKKGHIYFVNNKGLLLYKGKGFSGKDYHILKGYSMLFKNEKGKWGVWGAGGQEILPFEYDTVGTLGVMGYFIGKDKRFALLDDFGRLRYSLQAWLPKWSRGGPYYQDSLAHLHVLKNQNLVPLKAIPEILRDRYINFSYRSAAVVEPENPLGLQPGIYNRSLQRIAPYNPGYRNIIEHNKITICDAMRKNMAITDTNGRLLIPFFPMPDLVRINENQVFAAYNDGKAFCFRLMNGKFIPFSVTLDSLSFPRRNGVFSSGSDALIFYRDDGSKGLVNGRGVILWDSLITDILPDNNFYQVKRSGKWGLLNYDMRYIQAPVADSIVKDNNNYRIFAKGLTGLFDTDRHIYIPPRYEAILERASLQNHFLPVKQKGGYALADQSGKILIGNLDSIHPSRDIPYVIGYENGRELSFSINEDGSLQKHENQKIRKTDYRGYIYDVVITRRQDHFGLYNNLTFQPVLTETFDAIEKLNDYFVAWKYKADKHLGMDSTILVSDKGEILMRFKGWRNPVQQGDYLYFNGPDTTPVIYNDIIIIPGGFGVAKSSGDHFFIVTQGNQTGIVAADGAWVIPLFSGTINDENLSDYGFMLGEIIPHRKSKKGKYFLITAEGKRKGKKLYDVLTFEEDGSIHYKKGKRTGYLKEADNPDDEEE